MLRITAIMLILEIFIIYTLKIKVEKLTKIFKNDKLLTLFLC